MIYQAFSFFRCWGLADATGSCQAPLFHPCSGRSMNIPVPESIGHMRVVAPWDLGFGGKDFGQGPHAGKCVVRVNGPFETGTGGLDVQFAHRGLERGSRVVGGDCMPRCRGIGEVVHDGVIGSW